ncbi:MAG: histidine--tRNA ligase [Eubacteriales bacterium]
MPSIKKPRGTSDILPPDSVSWRNIEEICRQKAVLSGYDEIRFPTFESTELFSRGVGSSTDIVQKEMYTFSDKDGRSLTLRPEGTACVCRSVVENGLYAGALPLKLFYIANFFRYEKPQAGRSREFSQFGCELFGTSLPESDAELILLADSVISGIGLGNYSLHINSIGCKTCRADYKRELVEYFSAHKSLLCPVCVGRLGSNPLRILDCKNESCAEVAKSAPVITDFLCGECLSDYTKLKALLKETGVKYKEDPKCVRGLDYYNGVVFEFVHHGIGAQSALGGGGRYDGLLGELGGPETPGIGFALGVSRLLLAAESERVDLAGKSTVPSVYIAHIGEKAGLAAMSIRESLKAAGAVCESDLMGRSVKAQLKYADKRLFDFAAVIGEEEIAKQSLEVKNLRSGETFSVSLDAGEILKIVNKS